MKITIIGGGNLGHAISSYIKWLHPDYMVNIITTKPDVYKSTIDLNILNETYPIKIDLVSNNYETIQKSNFIIITVPHFAKQQIMEKLKPYLSPETAIIVIPAGPGFDWYTKSINNDIWCFQRVPLICRTIVYGSSVAVYGTRPINKFVGLTNNQCNSALFNQQMTDLFGLAFIEMDSFLELTLTNSNPLLHPSRYITMWKNWKTQIPYKRNPYFYKEWDDNASILYTKADHELQQINKCFSFIKHPTTVFEHYGVTTIDELTNKLNNIESLNNIKSPMTFQKDGYYPNWDSRYLTEDILYGLLPIISIAIKCEINTPTLMSMYKWACQNAKISPKGLYIPFYSKNNLYDKNTLIKLYTKE